MPKLKKIGVYLRVSDEDQKVDSQKLEVLRYLEANALDLAKVEWFIDEGRSSETLNRPAFNKLRKAIDSGRIGVVVVFALDRISRTMVDGITLVAGWIEKGVRVIAVSQQVDFAAGVQGKMFAALLFGFAELEMERRRIRQRAGIEAARARGVYRGRRKGTFKGRPERARALRAKGLTLAEIGTALGVSTMSVCRYLRADYPVE